MTQPASDADALLSKFPGPITVYRSRKKWIWVLLGCLAFTAGGVWAIVDGAFWDWGAWGALAFFGGGTVISLAMLVPGAGALTLDRDGFEITSLYRRYRTRWMDATGFESVSIPPAVQKFVCYDNANAAGSVFAKASVAISGHNASLPDTYGLAAADLTRLMVGWRERASTSTRPSV